MKVCKKCKLEKPVSQFHNDRKRADGKYPNCMVCVNSYARNRHKNPEVKEKIRRYLEIKNNDFEFKEKAKIRGQRFYESIAGRTVTLLNNCRKSPSGKTIKPTVTFEHIESSLKLGFCAVTGLKFQLDRAHQIETGNKKNPYAPSIDRINPNEGYTNENTRIVCWWYNMAKGELTDQQMYEMCKTVVRKHESR